MVKFTISVDEEFVKLVRETAKLEGRTISGLIKIAIKKHLKVND